MDKRYGYSIECGHLNAAQVGVSPRHPSKDVITTIRLHRSLIN